MEIHKWESSTGIIIGIDYDKCKGHEECVEVCPVEVFQMKEGKSIANNINKCIECCACVMACPAGAIEHSSC